MTREQFYTEFSKLTTDEDRINFMEKSLDQKYTFDQLDQPDALMSRFDISEPKTNSASSEIAKVFIKCFGPIIVCRETTWRMKKPMTIVDDLTMKLEWYIRDDGFDADAIIRLVKMIAAFDKAGVTEAKKININTFTQLYVLDPVYYHPNDKPWAIGRY